MEKKAKRKFYCVVKGCDSKEMSDTIKFHRSPADKTINDKWCIALKVKKIPKFSVVCSKHFLPEDYLPAQKGARKFLKKNVIPSLHLPVSLITTLTKDPNLPQKRRNRLAIRNSKKFKLLEEQSTPLDLESDIISDQENETQLHDVEINSKLENETARPDSVINNVTESVKIDKSVQVDVNYQPVKKTVSILEMFGTNEQLFTWTGIKSFQILDCLVDCVQELRKGTNKRRIKLSIKDSILLTFIKLKLNLSYMAIGVLFNVSSKVTKKYFICTLKEIAQVLNVLIRWPSKEEILNNIPYCFENFKSTRIVLDCLEISIRQSKCLKCRIPTYSSYKSCCTVKFMLGVTPSGMISYVSKAYGGRVSDKKIFVRSNILNRMKRSVDSIMVDKGFLIDKECLDYGIKLIRPPFLRKNRQLTYKEATKNADIAAARVHVERRIQRIRIFKILQGPLETEVVPYINIIMRVVCGLTNLDSPILSKNKFISNK